MRELNLQIPRDLLKPKEDGENPDKSNSPKPTGLSVTTDSARKQGDVECVWAAVGEGGKND